MNGTNEINKQETGLDLSLNRKQKDTSKLDSILRGKVVCDDFKSISTLLKGSDAYNLYTHGEYFQKCNDLIQARYSFLKAGSLFKELGYKSMFTQSKIKLAELKDLGVYVSD